jgi:hypothetical protein
MALVNHAKKEINAKIIYFGPPGSGKGAALTFIYSRIKPVLRGELKHIPAGSDTLLLFDFSPFDAPLADGYRVRLHVYTLSGPVSNPATWKMTLKGCDGIVILINAAEERFAQAQASVAQLQDFLSAYGVGLSDTSTVLQLNCCGHEAQTTAVAHLPPALGLSGVPTCTSDTTSGQGVLETLSTLSRLVLDRIRSDLTQEKIDGQTDVTAESEPQPIVVPAAPSAEQQVLSSADAALHDGAECHVHLVAASPELDDASTTIRIPLEVVCGATSRRLVVTVAVTTTTIDLYTQS